MLRYEVVPVHPWNPDGNWRILAWAEAGAALDLGRFDAEWKAHQYLLTEHGHDTGFRVPKAMVVSRKIAQIWKSCGRLLRSRLYSRKTNT